MNAHRPLLAALAATALVCGCGRGGNATVTPTPAASMPSEAPAPARPVATPPSASSAPASAASPFANAKLPAPLPIPTIPPLPPARPGGLGLGEAQAIVLGALPDSAIFKDLVQVPQGWRLRVHADDPHAIAQLTQRLAQEGHFEVRPAAAGAASAPASGDVTLELAEHGLK